MNNNEFVTFPASVQQKLDDANALLHYGRPQEAMNAYQQAGVELARTNPMLLGALLAGQMGFRQITFDYADMYQTTVEVEHRILGFKVGCDVTVSTSSYRNSRSVRLS